MRMRKRHNLAPRMEKCAELIIKDFHDYCADPLAEAQWLSHFPGYKELHLELGCGKGRFTVETAAANPDVMFIAVEKVADAMIIAIERVKERGLKNVRFIEGDAAKLMEMFSNSGELDRIYINFCDPWPKSRDAKFRLTAPNFLRMYANVLKKGSEIHFKTDNTPLFDWSAEQFENEGWAISQFTHDLHENGPVGVMTDYEAKFYAEGLKINRLVATNTEKTADTSAGTVPRIRNAALRDARGYDESVSANEESSK